MASGHIATLETRIASGWQWQRLPIFLLAVLVLGVVAFATLQPVKVLPRIRPAPAFILTDQAGQRLTNEDLRGQITLYAFGYTRCGAACEQQDAIMRAVQARAAKLNAADLRMGLLTLMFDPEHDTPEAMQAYGAAVGADPAVWRFATGDPTRLKQAIGGGFEVYYTPNADGTYTFEPTLVLADGLGVIRGEYRSRAQSLDAETILRQLDVLERELRSSSGTSRLAYEAAHFFLCYAH